MAHILRMLLPGVWVGILGCLAFIAMPAVFGTLDVAAAGAVARRVFAVEAPVSLLFGIVILMVERRDALQRHLADGRSQFSAEMMLALGALFCTVAGYYGLQPMMVAARTGAATPLGLAPLHALSTTLFGLKGLLVLALAWKAARLRPSS